MSEGRAAIFSCVLGVFFFVEWDLLETESGFGVWKVLMIKKNLFFFSFNFNKCTK